MQQRIFEATAAELMLMTAGHTFPRLTRFAAANKGRRISVTIRSETTGHSFFLLDVTITPDGRLLLIEANGSECGPAQCRGRERRPPCLPHLPGISGQTPVQRTNGGPVGASTRLPPYS